MAFSTHAGCGGAMRQWEALRAKIMGGREKEGGGGVGASGFLLASGARARVGGDALPEAGRTLGLA